MLSRSVIEEPTTTQTTTCTNRAFFSDTISESASLKRREAATQCVRLLSGGHRMASLFVYRHPNSP